MKYRNDEKGIVIFDGTYRVNGKPVISIKGTLWKLIPISASKIKDNKVFFDYKEDFEIEPAPIEHEVIDHRGRKYIEAIFRSIDDAKKAAKKAINEGIKVYEPKYTKLSYLHIKDFYPYFYVDDPNAVKLAKELIEQSEEHIIKVETIEAYDMHLKKRTFFKIIYTNPRITRSIRKELEKAGYKTYEADVAFFLRYLIDNDFTINHPPSKYILYYDIEVAHPPGVFPEPEKAEWPIISIGIMTGTGRKDIKILNPKKRGYQQLLEERDMIKWFLELAEKHVVISGWNSSNFDFPYIIKRARKINDEILKKHFGWNSFYKKVRAQLEEEIDGKIVGNTYYTKKIKEYRMNYNMTTQEAIQKIIDDEASRRVNKAFKKWKASNMDKYKDELIEMPLIVTDIDLLTLYKKFVDHKLPSYKLDYIAKIEGFGGKEEIDIGNITEIWKKTPEKLRSYNLRDVDLVFKIDQKRELIKKFFTFAGVSGAPPKIMFNEKRGLATNKLIDSKVLRIAKNRNMVLPTGGEIEEEGGKKYSGGYVHTPKPGIYDNIIVLDFNSMYPSIIIAFNISADTFCENDDCPIKAPIGSFRNDVQGIAVEAVMELFQLKMEIKKKLKKLKKELGPDAPEVRALETYYGGVKGVLNSIYGTYGYQKFRLYDKRIAENITTLGRTIWKMVAEIAEKELGYEAIYGDTDSIWFKAKSTDMDDIIKEAEKLADYLTMRTREELKKRYNANSDIFQFDPDKIYKKLILFKKKNYAGLIAAVGTEKLAEPKFDAAGLLSRGDISDAQKEFLTELINMTLNGATKKEVYQKIREWYDRFMAGEVDEKLVKWKALSKSLDEYKSLQTHARAYKYLVEVRKIPPTDLQKVGYIKYGPKTEQFVAFAPGDKVEIKDEWRPYIWSNQFESLLEKYIYLVIPKIDIRTMSRQENLTAFFKA